MTGSRDHASRERCGAKTRHGAHCGLPAGWGTEHPGIGACRIHGGNMPNHVIAAAGEAARRAAERFALPVVTTPADALRDELARSNGLVIWLTARCAELAEGDGLVWGTERRIIRPPVPGSRQGQPAVEVHQAARLHPLAAWLERERRHLAHVAAEMARIGIEARMARVSEMQAVQLRRAMDAIFTDLDLTPEQKARLPEVVPRRVRELRAVPGA